MNEAFQLYFRHLLEKYKLSQRELALRSGVNYVTINRLLNGYGFQPMPLLIESIAIGLGCNQAERYAMHSFVNPVIEKLLTAASGVLRHWREFGPESGFDERIELFLSPFVDEGISRPLQISTGCAAACEYTEVAKDE